VNQAMATSCGKPLVGCAAHRLNLEIQNYLISWESLLSKVNAVMVKLGTLKNSALLRRHTPLRPIKRCVTRWIGAYLMLKRYQKIKEHVHMMSKDDQQLADLVPTFAEERSLTRLCEHLRNLSSVMASLQRYDCSLSEARILFDSVLAKYPSMNVYISTDSDILHSPTFDSGVIKILRGEGCFTDEELDAVASLLIRQPAEPPDRSTNQSSETSRKTSFAAQALESFNKKRATTGLYLSPAFIPCSSATVESLFSVAKHVFFSRRLGLSRIHIEQQLFLKANSDLWDLETVSLMVGDEYDGDKDDEITGTLVNSDDDDDELDILLQ